MVKRGKNLCAGGKTGLDNPRGGMVKYWLFIGGLVAAVTKPDKMLGGARFLVRLFFAPFRS